MASNTCTYNDFHQSRIASPPRPSAEISLVAQAQELQAKKNPGRFHPGFSLFALANDLGDLYRVSLQAFLALDDGER
ncbi:MAG: hypothetical protein ABIW30_05540, partial [Arenimonas sp.]